MGAKLTNLIGQKFNRLLVLDKIESKAYGNYKKRQWKCLCDCGNISFVITSQLTKNLTKSCGCLHNEKSAQNGTNSRYKVANINAGYNSIYRAYKSNAKKRNLDFTITLIEFTELLNQNCHYCDIKPSRIYDKSYYHIIYNGVDRINNDLGYIKNNVVSCCKTCNIAKNNLKYEDFLSWIKRLTNNYRNLQKIQNLYDTQRLPDYQEANSRISESINTGGEASDTRTAL